MICSKCGAENNETARFCKYCGSKLELKKICPACGVIVGKNAKFCRSCGENLATGKSVKKQSNQEVRKKRENLANTETRELCEPCRSEQASHEKPQQYLIYHNHQPQRWVQKSDYNISDNHVPGGGHDNHSTANGVARENPSIREIDLPAWYRPLSMGAYFGWGLLFTCVPFGFIVAIVIAAGNTDSLNLRNFARAILCLMVTIGIIILIAVLIMNYNGVIVL